MGEVGVAVTALPLVIQVRRYAAGRGMERIDFSTIGVSVPIGAIQGAVRRQFAGQPVDAGVIAQGASLGGVVGGARRIGQRAKVVIEGSVLLKDDDDVLEV